MLMYLRIGILDVAREPGNEAEAKTVFDADETSVVDISSGKEGLDEVVCFPDLPA